MQLLIASLKEKAVSWDIIGKCVASEGQLPNLRDYPHQPRIAGDVGREHRG